MFTGVHRRIYWMDCATMEQVLYNTCFRSIRSLNNKHLIQVGGIINFNIYQTQTQFHWNIILREFLARATIFPSSQFKNLQLLTNITSLIHFERKYFVYNLNGIPKKQKKRKKRKKTPKHRFRAKSNRVKSSQVE